MLGMFSFLSMMGNYDDRKVARYEDDELIVSTCYVTDGMHVYETAIADPRYTNDRWVIVDAYDTEEEAQQGHDAWVDKMKNDPPEKLVDCMNAQLGQLCGAVGCDMEFPREDEPNA